MSRSQRGFTLIEIVVAIAIGLSLLGVIATLAARDQNDARIARAQQQIPLIVQSAQALFPPASSNDYTGLNTNAVGPLLPSDMASQSGANWSLTNPWGGSYVVGGAMYATAGVSEQILIQADQIPKSACLSLARNTGDSFDVVVINARVVKSTRPGDQPVAGSPSPAAGAWTDNNTMSTYCALAATATLAWEKL